MRGLTRNVGRVYTGSQSRAFDQRAMDEFAIPGIRLMHRAGRAALAALRERWPEASSLTVVCGSGNNAGDGYVIAGLAADAGLAVQLVQVADPRKLRGDALTASRFAACRLGRIEQCSQWQATGDVVVDALLGTGARGEVREPFRDAIERINASGKPVLAVDLPSGVDADSGGLLTANPVRADLTITFVAAKLGLLTGAAVDYVGEVLLDALDLPAEVYDLAGVRVVDGEDLTALDRRRNAHKGDFGRLLIVGGEADMGGAVLLAGEAALRSGAGLVSIATRAVNRAAILARRPELMTRAAQTPQDIADLVASASAIVVGPGLGRDAWGSALLHCCIASGKPLLVDADGLNLLAEAKAGDRCAPYPAPTSPPNGTANLGRLPTGAVLTPHPGEAGRLLGKDAAWVQSNRPRAAAELSSQGAVVVLKGAGTLVAEDGATIALCTLGNPGMATAGSGDVLAGIVGALLARGLPPRRAAELGVWLHARAGDEALAAGRASLLASDIVQALRLTP